MRWPRPPKARTPARGSSGSRRPLSITATRMASKDALLSRMPSWPLPSMVVLYNASWPRPATSTAGPAMVVNSLRSTCARPLSVSRRPLPPLSRTAESAMRRVVSSSISPAKAKAVRVSSACCTSTRPPGRTRMPCHKPSLSGPGSVVSCARCPAIPAIVNAPSTINSVKSADAPRRPRSKRAKDTVLGPMCSSDPTGTSKSACTARSPSH